jgi:hypothetical protein
MLAWLEHHLGIRLERRRIRFEDGTWLEVDGASDDPPILVEAWAHQGPPKSAQKMKVVNDAFKLLAVQRLVADDARLVLLFADEAAALPFRAGTWRSAALREAGIEVLVAELPDETLGLVRAAQKRQFR